MEETWDFWEKEGRSDYLATLKTILMAFYIDICVPISVPIIIIIPVLILCHKKGEAYIC
jgi:hypothetical protein